MKEYKKTILKVSSVSIPIGLLNIAMAIMSWLSNNVNNWKFWLTWIPLWIGMFLTITSVVVLIEYYVFGEEI